MSTKPANLTRRHALTALPCLALAACGGQPSGIFPPPPDGSHSPIKRFSADKTNYLLGDEPVVTVDFDAGTAQISILGDTVGPWPIRPNEPLRLPKLSRSIDLRLTLTLGNVETVAQRSLPVPVRGQYRDTGIRLNAELHAVAALPDGAALLVGGTRGANTLSDAVEHVNAHSGRIDRIANLSSGRTGHRLFALPDARYLVLGGTTTAPSAPHAEVIDLRSATVSPVHSGMTSNRQEFAALALADGRIVVSSGRIVEIFQPSILQFQRVPQPLQSARSGHRMALLPDGRVLIAGGYGVSTIAEVLDPVSLSLDILATSNDALALAQSADATGGFRLPLFAGGEDLHGGLSDAIHGFDAASLRWVRATTRLPRPLTLATSARLSDGSIGLFGGQHTGTPAGVPTVYSVGRGSDPTTITASAWPDMPQGRLWHQTTTLSTGHVLITGGLDRDLNFASSVLLFE